MAQFHAMHQGMVVATSRKALVKKSILIDKTSKRQCIEGYREISNILVQ